VVDFEGLSRERYERATPEERLRIDVARERARVEVERPRVDVPALRTDCFTGKEREVAVTLLVKPGHDGALYVFIDRGGPTGYESAEYSRLFAPGDARDWAACHGTQGRWDALVVPSSSLKTAHDFFEPLRKGGVLV